MVGDRMRIVQIRKSAVAVLDEKNILREQDPCANAKKYKAAREPKCNCMTCWSKWYQRSRTKSQK